MNQQRYLVARFVPDLRRNEPRNIGVMLWTRTRVASKFLPTERAEAFGVDAPMYSRWVNFWTSTCDAGNLDLGRDGVVLAKKTSDFMDALLDTQRANFQLVSRGFVKESIPKADVDLVVGRLFSDLVDLPAEEHAVRKSKPHVTALCKEAFGEAGLLDDPKFVHNVQSHIPCKVGKSAFRKFPVNYRLGAEESPTALFHRVNLTEESSVDSVSYMFEKIVAANIVHQKRCGALIAPVIDKEPIAGALEQIAQHCVPIDLASITAASVLLSSVAYGKAA